MSGDLIVRIGTKLILPFILLFALYVQFHGDYSPGGGFQAGVIASGMVFLTAITFGLDAAKRVAPERVAHFMVPLGILIFAVTGATGFLIGKNYMDYAFLSHDPVVAREWGIILVEFGVLVTVAGTMTSLFYAFVDRGR